MQGDFQDYLLGRSDNMEARIAPHPRMSAAEQLGIYRRGYGLRLVEALGNDFPGLKAMLGAPAFEDLCHTYVAAHPSRHPSLRALGRSLPGFLGAMAIPPHVLAAGMAHFDWAVAKAFDAADQPRAGLADLLMLPPTAWDSFALVFSDTVSVFEGDAALGTLRHDLLRGREQLSVSAGDGVTWLIWRQGEGVQYRPMPEDEAAALNLMRLQATFGAMCRLVAERFGNPNAALRCAEMLKDWLESGLVVAICHDGAMTI